MKQIKIISDGNPYTTQMLNHDGTPIVGVRKIVITGEADKLFSAVVTFDNVALELYAQADLPQEGEQDGSE